MTRFIKPVFHCAIKNQKMANKLSDGKRRISSAQDKKLIAKVQKLADEMNITFTDALKMALENLIAEYEHEKKSKEQKK